MFFAWKIVIIFGINSSCRTENSLSRETGLGAQERETWQNFSIVLGQALFTCTRTWQYHAVKDALDPVLQSSYSSSFSHSSSVQVPDIYFDLVVFRMSDYHFWCLFLLDGPKSEFGKMFGIDCSRLLFSPTPLPSRSPLLLRNFLLTLGLRLRFPTCSLSPPWKGKETAATQAAVCAKPLFFKLIQRAFQNVGKRKCGGIKRSKIT